MAENAKQAHTGSQGHPRSGCQCAGHREGTMFNRRRRGSLAQELGKSLGGVMATMGMFAFCKTAGLANYSTPPQVGETTFYSSTYLGGVGDLYAPFPAEDARLVMLLGATAVLLGTALRIKSYWKVLGHEG